MKIELKFHLESHAELVELVQKLGSAAVTEAVVTATTAPAEDKPAPKRGRKPAQEETTPPVIEQAPVAQPTAPVFTPPPAPPVQQPAAPAFDRTAALSYVQAEIAAIQALGVQGPVIAAKMAECYNAVGAQIGKKLGEFDDAMLAQLMPLIANGLTQLKQSAAANGFSV
jgi:hypothetical protein